MVELMRLAFDDTTIALDAFLSEGALKLVGLDRGSTPREFFGSDDYEYTLTVSAIDVPRVRDLLATELETEAAAEPDVLELLVRSFRQGKFDSDSAFRDWLSGHGISSSLITWS